MGAGAAAEVSEQIKGKSKDDLVATFRGLSAAERAALKEALEAAEIETPGVEVMMAVSGEKVEVDLTGVSDSGALLALVAAKIGKTRKQTQLLEGTRALQDADAVPSRVTVVVNQPVWNKNPQTETWAEHGRGKETTCPRCNDDSPVCYDSTNMMHGYIDSWRCPECGWTWRCKVSANDD
mmetsp:Transcript_65481/g.174450  ORF Transcript_65481/g.174450 Transcript_65481/m.174450 type:complete len:180 (-) Transcript_65481:64-603(-)